MLSFLGLPGFQPFAIAGLIVLGLLAVETIGLLFGHSISAMLDAALHLHGPELHLEHDGGDAGGLHAGIDYHGGNSVFGTVFDWLNAGRVPLLILLIAAIGSFAVIGLVLQIVAMHVAVPLPSSIAAVVAVLGALPSTRWTSRAVAKVVPRDESYVIAATDLVGLTGRVTLGPVAAGSAARAKIQDRFGNMHFPRVRPASRELVIPEGAAILVVDRVGGELAVVPAEGRLVEEAQASSD
jgi:hypothetical protein